ncbi:mitochondrial carrier family [Micromonas commoda]|uniref:Mitochondrial carrier family n=1 Tax=Micromonas commoda (strain RCC299 / NOUM17 / CCMP2709) TaxID=296587 RepID=C1FIT5_MICCC|nr:mitochondrial carrier family [Micromonas commoda]ACO70232.1 mitochondrial carrier family [Micromonas commoda]|eukprot:XP_002508974.1 mitochondrial carrier family [Micromonas commoda]
MAATLDPGTQAGIGAFAGLVEVSVNQPLHTLKNFTQDGRVLPMNPAVWYRGWSAGVLIGVPMAVVQFGGSRSLERAFGSASFGSSGGDATRDDVPARWSTRIASAALAGAVSGAVINPLDVCMTQQQKFGGSLRAVATRLARTHGASVATRAAWATMAREGFYACGYLCAAPWLRDRLDGHAVQHVGGGHGAPNGGNGAASIGGNRSSWNGFVAAASAGAAAGVLTQPVDTVKTLMQSNLGDGRNVRAAGYLETAMALVKRDGASALWRGTAPRALRIASATFVLATVNERAGEYAAGASWAVDGVAEANPS